MKIESVEDSLWLSGKVRATGRVNVEKDSSSEEFYVHDISLNVSTHANGIHVGSTISMDVYETMGTEEDWDKIDKMMRGLFEKRRELEESIAIHNENL